MRLLIISSWVSSGHVGLSAAAPALTLLGHEVIQVPAVILSNHPGWPRTAVHPIPADTMAAMLGAVDDNGWLRACDAVLTGYMPSPQHVAVASKTIEQLRQDPNPPNIVVDPVMGDEPNGLYIPEDAATAVRNHLLPLADIVTPNRFELAWMSGHSTDTLTNAFQAAQKLKTRSRGVIVHVTSAPVSRGQTGVLTVGPEAPLLYPVTRLDGVPHGVGDVFSALVAANETAGSAVGKLDALVQGSLDAPHLRIAELARDWTTAPAIAATQLTP